MNAAPAGPARFKGKVALVTGAASGIGLATAQRLASEGARVLLADIDETKLAAAVAGLPNAGAHLAAPCDVGDEAQVEQALALAHTQLGGLDVIVNNAAVMTFTPLAALALADWQRVLRINLTGPFLFIRAALASMPRGGAVVNVASVHAERTTADVGPYASSKAGLIGLTHVASIEGAARGIRVNAVLPGAVDTPMLWRNPDLKNGVETLDRSMLGEPPDIAAAIVFLASDDARFITGAALRVDGGRLARL